MSKLTLEKTMKTSFLEMNDPEAAASKKAFQDYNHRIRLLGETARLEEAAIRELIDPSRDVSDAICSLAGVALSDERRGKLLYHPGVSSVIVGETGNIMGVYESPNDIPVLTAYGPGLMWALLKVGQERYACCRARSSAAEEEGYKVITEALHGQDMATVPYGQRPHIGGATAQKSLHPESTSLRKYETVGLHAGVSGVVGTEQLWWLAAFDKELQLAATEAVQRGYLDGFRGNLFAGSLDSTLGAVMLQSIIDGTTLQPGQYTDLAVQSIKRRVKMGINVH